MGMVDMFILYPWVGFKISSKSISGNAYPHFLSSKFFSSAKLWFLLPNMEVNLIIRLKVLLGNSYFVNSVLLLVQSQLHVSWFVLECPWKPRTYEYYNSKLFSSQWLELTILFVLFSVLSGYYFYFGRYCHILFIKQKYSLPNLNITPWLFLTGGKSGWFCYWTKRHQLVAFFFPSQGRSVEVSLAF